MKYNIIFLEGVRNIGKSSQLVLLKQELLKDQEVARFDFNSNFTPDELSNKINELRNWCSNNPKGVALIQGSVAHSIVYNDLVIGKYGDSYPAFEVPIKNFFNLLREFKVINILMNTRDYNYLEKRSSDVFNMTEYLQTYGGFVYFENSNIACNFKWIPAIVNQYDSILQVNDKIKKLLI
jgi:hypothetical protein